MKRKGMTHCKVHPCHGLLRHRGDDFRRAPLEWAPRQAPDLCGDKILFSESFDLDGPIVFAEACRLGVEGIVSKRVGSRYVLGQSDAWVKTLNTVYDR